MPAVTVSCTTHVDAIGLHSTGSAVKGVVVLHKAYLVPLKPPEATPLAQSHHILALRPHQVPQHPSCYKPQEGLLSSVA
jgi:hypothetical protein